MARAAVIVRVKVEGAAAEVRCNDIPMAHIEEGAPGVTFPINHVMVDGVNNVEVILRPGESPSKVRDGDVAQSADGVTVLVDASTYGPDNIPGDDPGTGLMRLRWDGAGEERFPYSVSGDFEVASPFAPWAWERAPVLALDGPTITEAADVIRAIHAAFARKDFNAVTRWKERATREVAVAYGEDWAENEASAAQALNGDLERAGLGDGAARRRALRPAPRRERTSHRGHREGLGPRSCAAPKTLRARAR
ncbi:MAG: hypothetical protein R3A52_21990 [Polyangiales bacterium]